MASGVATGADTDSRVARLRIIEQDGQSAGLIVCAAVVHAKIRIGLPVEAVELAAFAVRRFSRRVPDAAAFGWLVLGGAIASLAIGRLRDASTLLARVRRDRTDCDDVARGYVAVVHALRGELGQALGASQGMSTSSHPTAQAAAMVAEALCASHTGENARIHESLGALDMARPVDPTLDVLRRCLGIRAARASDTQDAGAESLRLLEASASAAGGQLAHEAVAATLARVLLGAGQPGAVFSALASHDTPTMHGADDFHSFCLPVHRAFALIALGLHSEALDETEHCLRMPEHSRTTLASVRLSRAAALVELDRRRAALTECRRLERDFGPRATVGGATLLVPRVLDHVRELARVDGLDLASTLGATDHSPSMALDAVHAHLGTLSRREREVLRALDQPLPLPAVAAQLFIAPNTLKVHTRNLYAKLNVSSRHEAVDLAMSYGFYALTAPR